MLDNPRSPRVRGVAKLAKRDARSETGLFLLEGPQAVAEAFPQQVAIHIPQSTEHAHPYPHLGDIPPHRAPRHPWPAV